MRNFLGQIRFKFMDNDYVVKNISTSNILNSTEKLNILCNKMMTQISEIEISEIHDCEQLFNTTPRCNTRVNNVIGFGGNYEHRDSYVIDKKNTFSSSNLKCKNENLNDNDNNINNANITYISKNKKKTKSNKNNFAKATKKRRKINTLMFPYSRPGLRDTSSLRSPTLGTSVNGNVGNSVSVQTVNHDNNKNNDNNDNNNNNNTTDSSIRRQYRQITRGYANRMLNSKHETDLDGWDEFDAVPDIDHWWKESSICFWIVDCDI